MVKPALRSQNGMAWIRKRSRAETVDVDGEDELRAPVIFCDDLVVGPGPGKTFRKVQVQARPFARSRSRSNCPNCGCKLSSSSPASLAASPPSSSPASSCLRLRLRRLPSSPSSSESLPVGQASAGVDDNHWVPESLCFADEASGLETVNPAEEALPEPIVAQRMPEPSLSLTQPDSQIGTGTSQVETETMPYNCDRYGNPVALHSDIVINVDSQLRDAECDSMVTTRTSRFFARE